MRQPQGSARGRGGGHTWNSVPVQLAVPARMGIRPRCELRRSGPAQSPQPQQERPPAGDSPHGSLSPGGIQVPAPDPSGVLLGEAALGEGWGDWLEAVDRGMSGGRGDTGDHTGDKNHEDSVPAWNGSGGGSTENGPESPTRGTKTPAALGLVRATGVVGPLLPHRPGASPPPRPVAITFTCSDHITFLVITRKLWLPPKRLTWQDTQVRAKLRTRAAQGWARGHQVGKWTPRREEAGRMTLLQGHTPDDTRAASLHCEARWAAAANLTENEVCHRSPSGPGPRTSLFSYPPIGFLGLL